MNLHPDAVYHLMDPPDSPDRLSRWTRFLLFLLIPLVVGFGFVVEMRGALLVHRWTDLSVFLRAAWAVKHDEDLYRTTDERGLHYHYPPLLAIVLLPLADPPIGQPEAWTVPFAVSVGLWYAFSMGALAFGVHHLARALERHCPGIRARSQPGNATWWALRLAPCFACLPAIGFALSLGQVNVLWLALLCGMAAAVVNGRSMQAGVWLAGAICLKVLPIFLLVYPLWRRDVRLLAGTAIGLVLGLGVIPALVLGPERMLVYGEQWADAVLLPAFGLGGDGSRGEELTDAAATQNQALMTVWHHTVFVDWHRKPTEVPAALRWTAWSIGGLFTLVTLIAAGRRRPEAAHAEVLFLGCLTINMLLLAPAGHPHYLVLAIPMMMALLVQQWGQHPSAWLSRPLRWLLVANAVAFAAPLLHDSPLLFQLGLPMYVTLFLWFTAVRTLWMLRAAEFAVPMAPLVDVDSGQMEFKPAA